MAKRDMSCGLCNKVNNVDAATLKKHLIAKHGISEKELKKY